jgi:hypothetical protein
MKSGYRESVAKVWVTSLDTLAVHAHAITVGSTCTSTVDNGNDLYPPFCSVPIGVSFLCTYIIVTHCFK